MAFTLNLKNDDTTLTLNGGSDYTVLQQGFSAPSPRPRLSISGNIFRHGSDLLERRYENRTVTIPVRIKSTSQDDLIANINAIYDLLERIAEFSTRGLNSQGKLTVQWDGATNSIDFHVLEGRLNVPALSTSHVVNTEMVPAALTLLCKPFPFGSAETISNYVSNPGFETAATALGDWTENITATGTTARSTASVKHGVAALLLTMTNSGSSGQVVERTQVLTDVDGGETWSFAAWINFTALSNSRARLVALYNDGGATEQTVTRTTITSGFIQIKLENESVPAGATQVTLKLQLESTAASATGTLYFDSIIAVQASTVPTAWVSGRTIANHWDDDGQAHINYVDIYDVPGDMTALLQVKATEDENHTKLWMGCRHAGRVTSVVTLSTIFIEGESGSWSGDAAWVSAADANASDGNYGRWNDATTTMSSSASAPSVLTYNIGALQSRGQFRVLARARYAGAAASLGMGYAYGAISSSPAVAGDYNALSTTFAIYDLGALTIPPVTLPEGVTTATFTLRMAMYRTGGTTSEVHVDWIMLMPIDFGSGFVSKTAGTDVVMLDSRSDFKGIVLLDTSDVIQSFPADQLGKPPEAHPDGTRLFFAFEEAGGAAIDLDAHVSITYVPRFLQVAPA